MSLNESHCLNNEKSTSELGISMQAKQIASLCNYVAKYNELNDIDGIDFPVPAIWTITTKKINKIFKSNTPVEKYIQLYLHYRNYLMQRHVEGKTTTNSRRMLILQLNKDRIEKLMQKTGNKKTIKKSVRVSWKKEIKSKHPVTSELQNQKIKIQSPHATFAKGTFGSTKSVGNNVQPSCSGILKKQMKFQENVSPAANNDSISFAKGMFGKLRKLSEEECAWDVDKNGGSKVMDRQKEESSKQDEYGEKHMAKLLSSVPYLSQMSDEDSDVENEVTTNSLSFHNVSDLHVEKTQSDLLSVEQFEECVTKGKPHITLANRTFGSMKNKRKSEEDASAPGDDDSISFAKGMFGKLRKLSEEECAWDVDKNGGSNVMDRQKEESSEQDEYGKKHMAKLLVSVPYLSKMSDEDSDVQNEVTTNSLSFRNVSDLHVEKTQSDLLSVQQFEECVTEEKSLITFANRTFGSMKNEIKSEEDAYASGDDDSISFAKGMFGKLRNLSKEECAYDARDVHTDGESKVAYGEKIESSKADENLAVQLSSVKSTMSLADVDKFEAEKVHSTISNVESFDKNAYYRLPDNCLAKNNLQKIKIKSEESCVSYEVNTSICQDANVYSSKHEHCGQFISRSDQLSELEIKSEKPTNYTIASNEVMKSSDHDEVKNTNKFAYSNTPKKSQLINETFSGNDKNSVKYELPRSMSCPPQSDFVSAVTCVTNCPSATEAVTLEQDYTQKGQEMIDEVIAIKDNLATFHNILEEINNLKNENSNMLDVIIDTVKSKVDVVYDLIDL